MRKIGLKSIVCALVLAILAGSVAVGLAIGAHYLIPPFEYRAIIVTVFFIIALVMCELRLYRFLALGLPIGEIPIGSPAEFRYDMATLVQLVFWSPFITAQIWPVTMSRLIFRWMGADIGENSYSGGAILDPPFVKIGRNTLLGHHSLLCPHELEGSWISHQRIEIGDNVTIGAFAIVMPGCKIGNGAIIGMNALVAKGTVVGDNEIWGGVPARFIKSTVAPREER